MHMVANNPEQEEAQKRLQWTMPATPWRLAFNVSYLLDVLNVLKSSKIRFILSDSNSSALLEEDSNPAALCTLLCQCVFDSHSLEADFRRCPCC